MLPASDPVVPRRHAMGREIQERRRLLGLTQEEAATAAGVSVGAWRSTEAGTRRPRPQTFAAILDTLGLTPDDLRHAVPEPEQLEEYRDDLRRLVDDVPVDLAPLLLEVARLLVAGHRAAGDEGRGG
ncbi:MAG TPA: helix-turn-helix transcriptional regulator [Egicoccus sp.]|nr:helix-turn-helix transcriptional regulator [Egicoccus sp.]HSK21698.1 helix-turn-helix transcriptional regulator [Egicoccus sp.]